MFKSKHYAAGCFKQLEMLASSLKQGQTEILCFAQILVV